MAKKEIITSLSVILLGIIFLTALVFFLKNKTEENPIEEIALQPVEHQESKDVVISCGKDFNCFIDASKKCQEAEVTHSVAVNILGATHRSTTYLEIIKNGRKCNLYEKTMSASVDYPDNTPDEVKNMGKTVSEATIGLEGTCVFDNASDLTNALLEVSRGNFSTGGHKNAVCSGSRYETRSLQLN